MSRSWQFVYEGMQFSAGIKIKAKNGTLGVTTEKELVLLDDKGETLASALVEDVVFKFGTLDPGAATANIMGTKWYLVFEPPMKTGLFSGGLAGGIAHAQREDVIAARAIREKFKALVEKTQAE